MEFWLWNIAPKSVRRGNWRNYGEHVELMVLNKKPLGIRLL